jgi:hypothetical protein
MKNRSALLRIDGGAAINVATKPLYDAGITVVFAAGNSGGPDMLNQHTTSPWVVGVAAGTKDFGLADFSSRGRFDSTGGTVDVKRDRRRVRPDQPADALHRRLQHVPEAVGDGLEPTVRGAGCGAAPRSLSCISTPPRGVRPGSGPETREGRGGTGSLAGVQYATAPRPVSAACRCSSAR